MSFHTKYFTTIQELLPASCTLRRGLCFSFLTLVASCLLLTPAAGQVPNYRLKQIPISEGPSGTVQANQMNNLGMVVGFHTVGGVPTGYVYDHFGLIGLEKTVHSLTEWIPVQPGWTTSSCVGINNLGQVVGYFSNATSQRIGYYLDLDLIGGGTTPSWGELPKPSGSSYGKLINDNQDVLIYSSDTFHGHLYNLASGTFRTLTVPTSGAPLAFTTATKVDLNNSGQVVGNTLDNFAFRLTPGVLLEFPPLEKSSTCSINDVGLMAGTLPATGSGKTATPKRACHYGSQIHVLSSVESFAHDINNDGDVAGREGGVNALYHDGLKRWFLLDDLVVGSAADLDLWYQTPGKRAINLSDRKATTGFGQILALVNTTSSTGSGKNKVTTTVLRFFVLTPELPQPLP